MIRTTTTIVSRIRKSQYSSRISARHMSVINLSGKEAVDKFTKGNDKAVLYFTATWCPPCKMVSPIYDKLSTSNPEVAFGKVDVDDNNESAAEHQIAAIPTFIFFDKNNVHDRFSGADESQLGSLIQKLKDA